MKVLFLGATRGMGRSLARALAERGDALFLLGRDREDLARTAADLAARSPDHRACGQARFDLTDLTNLESTLDAADTALGGFDTVVITAGLYAPQADLEVDDAQVLQLLTVNFTNTVRLCEAVRRRLLSRGGGRLIVFSSVAGDRGRKPVAIYGASKAGLSHYLESLDHKFRSSGLITTCVKPGFVRTGMTDGLKPPPFAGEPDVVARRVLRAMDRGAPMVYAPAAWWWVLAIIRRLPRFVMRRIDF